MKNLGSTIKSLISKRGITGKELAQRVNLSETSLSKIVQGVTKPRQANFTRIIEELCQSQEEEQLLITAYSLVEDGIEDETAQLDPETYQKVEEERVRRYLQAKARSIAFREQVATVLTDDLIPFESPYSNSDIICDFFINRPARIAIECKANVKRDWDRTKTSARLLRNELPCSLVLVVVPDSESALDQEDSNMTIVPVSELANFLKAL